MKFDKQLERGSCLLYHEDSSLTDGLLFAVVKVLAGVWLLVQALFDKVEEGSVICDRLCHARGGRKESSGGREGRE